MLLVLNSATWTRGPEESAKLASDVKLAHKFGVHVLLAHEQPNVADGLLLWQTTAALGVPFDAFFNNPEGTTPRRLLVAGIYNEIAVPLKRGPYRPVSMALLAKAVATNTEAKEGSINALNAKHGTSGDLLSLAEKEAVVKDEDEVQPMLPTPHKSVRRKVAEAAGWAHPRKSAMEKYGVPANPLPPGLLSAVNHLSAVKQLSPRKLDATPRPEGKRTFRNEWACEERSKPRLPSRMPSQPQVAFASSSDMPDAEAGLAKPETGRRISRIPLAGGATSSSALAPQNEAP